MAPYLALLEQNLMKWNMQRKLERIEKVTFTLNTLPVRGRPHSFRKLVTVQKHCYSDLWKGLIMSVEETLKRVENV